MGPSEPAPEIRLTEFLFPSLLPLQPPKSLIELKTTLLQNQSTNYHFVVHFEPHWPWGLFERILARLIRYHLLEGKGMKRLELSRKSCWINVGLDDFILEASEPRRELRCWMALSVVPANVLEVVMRSVQDVMKTLPKVEFKCRLFGDERTMVDYEEAKRALAPSTLSPVFKRWFDTIADGD